MDHPTQTTLCSGTLSSSVGAPHLCSALAPQRASSCHAVAKRALCLTCGAGLQDLMTRPGTEVSVLGALARTVRLAFLPLELSSLERD